MQQTSTMRRRKAWLSVNTGTEGSMDGVLGQQSIPVQSFQQTPIGLDTTCISHYTIRSTCLHPPEHGLWRIADGKMMFEVFDNVVRLSAAPLLALYMFAICQAPCAHSCAKNRYVQYGSELRQQRWHSFGKQGVSSLGGLLMA